MYLNQKSCRMPDYGIALKVTWPSRRCLQTKLSRFHGCCQQKKRRPLLCQLSVPHYATVNW